MDPTAELQHQRRIAIHDVKNLQAQAQNALTLYERDGDVEKLLRGLANTVARAKTLVAFLEGS